MRVRKNIVPSAFTIANMFCGYFSVVSSINGKFVVASWLIVAASVLDALDGKVARLTKSASHFGVEYDSLADVISFGFAPAILVYRAIFSKWGTVGLFISFIPLVFGSVRLARFNVRLRGFDKAYFEGLPIPAAAVTMATFLVFNFHFWESPRWEKVFLGVMIFVSVLMVTTIRYDTLPNFGIHRSAPDRRKFLIAVIGLVLILFFPQETFFPLALGYVLSGPVRLSWNLLRSSNANQTQKAEDK